jgi:hypothetical protein
LKKILPILVISILVLSGLGVGALVIEKESMSSNETSSNERATHTPLAEYGTSTTCGFCKYAHGALKELYSEGQLDFYYITYVGNKNPTAYSHIKNYYNLYGYPTVWWDGGYKVNVGAGSVSGAKSTYTTSINQCGARAVEDVDIDLAVDWLGGTQIEVECTVTNNEASTYGGHIRVSIVEKESSMGWYDTAGHLYTMVFLDWAFNEPLSISSGGSWNDIMTWDGSSNGFPSITSNNILVIAAAYNDEWHQGYSYTNPPKPFDAYYVDECVATGPATNQGPGIPTIDGPNKGSPGNSYTFTFNTVDPDGDDVYYYVIWGDGQVEMWDGPHPSGVDVDISHTFDKTGTFTIRAKAKDTTGEQSGFVEHDIKMPRSKAMINPFQGLLEQFPNVFLFLRQLLGL